MFRINFKQFFVFVFTAVVAISCDNSPASSEEEHLDVDGLSIEHNGTEVYRELEGEVVINNISLGVNDTLDLTVRFLDHEGNEVDHDDDHDGDELGFEINNSDIIAIIMDDHDDDHDDDHVDEHCDELSESECESSDHCEWHADDNACEDAEGHDDDDHHEIEFELVGLSSGSTTFSLALMHDGHADYNSLSINATVNDMFSCSSKQLCIKSCCSVLIYAAK
tara:strand:- start:609 stop:1274 length:666 start_codon:yes stop_codon:yes gene_type:complete